MSNNPPPKNTTNGTTPIKLEEQLQASLNQQLQSIDWDSERQLISSLAKLQELESKIHELRSLLPDRILAPINPIVNPRRTSAASTSIPRNPQALSAALRKSATEGVAEIQSFKELWTSDDMQAIWHKVDEKLAETKGAFPQMEAGMWRVDYADLLREKDQEEKKNGDGDIKMDDIDDNEMQFPAAIYGSTEETDPTTIVQSFQARQIPGFKLASTRNDSTIIVSLGLAGLIFEIQEALNTTEAASEPTTTTTTTTTTATNKTPLPEWRVETRQHPSKPAAGTGTTSRLENAIVAQLNSRPRKWDLRFLLELILSYKDIRSLPCKRCSQLTDSTAQLPVLRRAIAPSPTTGEGGSAPGSGDGVVWEGYHVGCI